MHVVKIDETESPKTLVDSEDSSQDAMDSDGTSAEEFMGDGLPGERRGGQQEESSDTDSDCEF